MKKNLRTFLKIGLPILALGGLGISIPVALTSCAATASSTTSSTSTSAANYYENDLINNNFKGDKNKVFANNQHNNVNLASVAAIVNANILNYMYTTLNSSKMQPFMNWLKTKSILVVDAQIPNPKWVRIPTDNPGTEAQQIQAIQDDFVLDTPTIYSLLYSQPTNHELPGFGMKMALPSDQTNLDTLTHDWKGQIVATSPGKSSNSIFNAMKNSSDIVLYVYPDTSTWVTPALATKALTPLLTASSAAHASSAIIPVSLAKGFDSLNSPIGMAYLFSSLINGLGYSQTTDGVWSKQPNENLTNSLSSLYFAENPEQNNESSEVYQAIQAVTPYITLEQTFGYDLATYGYADPNKKAVFPFAEKYIHTLSDETKNANSHKLLSAYFNDTSMLLSLGFTPYYSTYIIDPGVLNEQGFKDGVVLPSYIRDIYPNLVANNESSAKDGQTVPLLQSKTGIWQHHVQPQANFLLSKKVGTVLADDWLMPEISGLYSNGDSVINHIIYNTQGDYTTNGQIFYTKNNTSAKYDSDTPVTNSSISNSGFMPSNLANNPNFKIGGKDYFSYNYENSTTGISGDFGNVCSSDARGFQWFANQLEQIQGQQFQVPKTTNSFDDVSNTTLNFEQLATWAAYNWNVLSLQEKTVPAKPDQTVTPPKKSKVVDNPVTDKNKKEQQEKPKQPENANPKKDDTKVIKKEVTSKSLSK